MMVQRFALLPAIAIASCIFTAATFAESEVSLEGVKCLMAGKNDAKAEKSAEWKKGKVYFCCDGCKAKFESMNDKQKAKVAAKANAQLVATKQYVQKGCPISGGPLNKDTAIKVAGAKVSFCCTNCKGKAEGLEGEKQLELVFGTKAFKTAKFEPVKSESTK